MRAWDISAATLTILITGACAVGALGVRVPPASPHSVADPDTDAEAVQLLYDPERLSYETLLEFFFRMHDPTTLNQQGGDKGTQYRSAIFTHGDEQEKKVKAIIEKVQKQWLKQDVLTQVVPAGEWWDAEDYHQLYLDKSELLWFDDSRMVMLT